MVFSACHTSSHRRGLIALVGAPSTPTAAKGINPPIITCAAMRAASLSRARTEIRGDVWRGTTVALVAVALAVAATAEERARQSPASTVVVRYFDAIERLGYQPTDWEHTQRLTTAA